MDPLSESPNMRYTVPDWALWAQAHAQPGANDLVSYLEAEWPEIPANIDMNTPRM